ncbi:MAG: hypothetical protein ACKVIX_05895 [Sphingomonadales bacterium]
MGLKNKPQFSLLNQSDFPKWDTFVDSCDSGTIFHKSIWLQCWYKKIHIIVTLDINQKIIAGWSFGIAKDKWNLKWCGKTQFLPISGPLFSKNLTINDTKHQLHFEGLLNFINKVDLINIDLHDAKLNPLLMKNLGFKSYVSQSFQISPNKKESWKNNISHGRKYKINRGRKLFEASNLNYTNELSPNDIYNSLAFLAKQRGYEKYYTLDKERLIEGLTTCHSKKLMKFDGIIDEYGELIFSTVLAQDKNRNYYLSAGEKTNSSEFSHARNLIMEKIIKETLEENKWFDFEGSMLSGVAKYFQSWGGQRIICHRFIKPNSLTGKLSLKFK